MLEHQSITPALKDVLKWKLGRLFKKKRAYVTDDDFKLKVNLLTKEDVETDEDFIIWLGHASFYIQIDGVKILTDPVFKNVPLTPRLVELPINVEHLNPDIILISHGHYDHLDIKSLEMLDIYRKNIKIIAPLNIGDYLRKEANIVELDWYESCTIEGVKVSAVKASHWHRRTPFDMNKALWCSFVIEGKHKTLFFAGDTALSEHFLEIESKVTSIDIALMPIGAYLPEVIMKTSHMNPKEAVEATLMLKAKQMIPYHYGTFKLSDEPIGEPYSWINKLKKEHNLKLDIKVLNVGEVFIS